MKIKIFNIFYLLMRNCATKILLLIFRLTLFLRQILCFYREHSFPLIKTILFQEKFCITYSIFFFTLRRTEKKSRRNMLTHQHLFNKNVSIQIKRLLIIHRDMRK
jgi:hypothetical protein